MNEFIVLIIIIVVLLYMTIGGGLEGILKRMEKKNEQQKT